MGRALVEIARDQQQLLSWKLVGLADGLNGPRDELDGCTDEF